jgi:hypothetical protein
MLNAVGTTFSLPISLNLFLAIVTECLKIWHWRDTAQILPSVIKYQASEERCARNICYHFDSRKLDIFEASVSFIVCIARAQCVRGPQL